MRLKILAIILFAVISVSAQVKTNVTTTNKPFKEVTTVTVDSASLEGFIKRYINRNSLTSTHTLTQIDAAVDKAQGAVVTVGTLTASGIYTNTSTNNIINSKQLYYKDLLINGAIGIKVLTTEIP